MPYGSATFRELATEPELGQRRLPTLARPPDP